MVPLAFEGKPRNHEHRTHANAAPETTTHGFTSHLRSSHAARCPASADPRILVLTQLGIVSLGQCSGTPDAVPERQGRAAFHCDGLGVLSVFCPDDVAVAAADTECVLPLRVRKGRQVVVFGVRAESNQPH